MTTQTNQQKESQEVITDKAREIWLAGLGIFSTIEEEGTRLFNKFVEKGKELEDRGAKLQEKAKAKVESIGAVDDITKFLEEKVNQAFQTLGVSSHSEVKELTEKVDQLTKTVEALAKKLDEKSK